MYFTKRGFDYVADTRRQLAGLSWDLCIFYELTPEASKHFSELIYHGDILAYIDYGVSIRLAMACDVT